MRKTPLMFNFLKSLFIKKTKQTQKVEEIPAQGVIESKESEMFKVTLVHKGGERYEIMTTGKLSKSGTGRFIHGKQRAINCFKSECSMMLVK